MQDTARRLYQLAQAESGLSRILTTSNFEALVDEALQAMASESTTSFPDIIKRLEDLYAQLYRWARSQQIQFVLQSKTAFEFHGMIRNRTGKKVTRAALYNFIGFICLSLASQLQLRLVLLKEPTSTPRSAKDAGLG